MGNFKDYMPLGGSWEIAELIGQGSYGKVYRAKRSEQGEMYYSAVKHISIPPDTCGSLSESGIVEDEAAGEYSKALQDLLISINLCYRLKGA
jgi:serine/threonine protein kinase